MEKIKIKYHTNITPLEYIGGGKSDWIDLRLAQNVSMKKGEFKYLSLGVSMQIPSGYEAIVAPRSSTFKNYGILMSNSIGVIDESFMGNNDIWMFPAYATRDIEIEKDTRIAQFRLFKHQPTIEFEEVEKLGEDRGGLGSTGTK